LALRQLRYREDEILTKTCKEVKKFDEKLAILLDDMYETMQKAEGVGLAAPQVGILKRVVVIDIGDERIDLVNPQIIETSGEQEGIEGCLSFPKLYGVVKRPNKVKIKAQDRNGNWFEKEGTELLARAFCHECDHLDGHVFTELVTEFVQD
jgi:peptide deformylase